MYTKKLNIVKIDSSTFKKKFELPVRNCSLSILSLGYFQVLSETPERASKEWVSASVQDSSNLARILHDNKELALKVQWEC